jgi:hypothetical protein
MLREIKRIIPLSAAKLAAVIYGAMGVVVGFPIALATVLPSIIHGREAGNESFPPYDHCDRFGDSHYRPTVLRFAWIHYRWSSAQRSTICCAKWLGGLQVEAE